MSIAERGEWNFAWFRGDLFRSLQVASLSRRWLNSLSLAFRVVALWLLGWVPLLILSRANAQSALFLRDIPTHVQLLLSTALLILPEPYIGGYLASATRQLHELAPIEHRASLNAEHHRRMEGAPLAQWVIAGIALALSAANVLGATPSWLDSSPLALDSPGMTWAGEWYRWVSLPLYRFLILRWLWRLGCWSIFLRRAARARLRLAAGHPDRMGGLGFLVFTQASLWPLVLAISLNVEAHLAGPGMQLGGSLLDQMKPLIVVGVMALLLTLGLLAPFWFLLARLKRNAREIYSSAGAHLVGELERQGFDSNVRGASTVRTLETLNANTERLRCVLYTRMTVVMIAAAAIFPIVPVLIAEGDWADVARLVGKAVMGVK